MCTPNQPDDSRQWSSIDIFIFTNGQQNTPPRKYHLQADELNMWDTTLSHLAASQYGSNTSRMELYSIEGNKIDGPLELRHGLTYVAVVPPEEFIQADYNTYLMKASRSWQKRRKLLQLCVDYDNLSGKDTNGADAPINSAMDNISIENRKLIERKSSSVDVNSKINVTVLRPKVYINNNQKHFNNNTTIRNNRRNVNKEENTKVNQPLKRNNTRYTRNVQNQKSNAIPILKSPKVTAKTKTPDIKKDYNTLYNKRNITKATSDDVTKKIQNGNVPINQSLENLLVNSEIDNIIDFDTCNCNSISDMLTVTSSKTIILKSVSANGSCINENAAMETDTLQNTDQKITKDRSISIKCGGVLTLKLNIHVNDNETSNEINNAHNLKTTQSNPLLPVTEKASQVNVDFDINVASLKKLYCEDDKDPNFAILRSIKEQIHDSKIPLGKENNKIFYFIPSEKDDKINSCKCEDDKIQITNKQNKNAELLPLHELIELVTPTTIDPNSKLQQYPDVQIIATEQTIPPTIKPDLGVEPYQVVQTATEQTSTPTIEPNLRVEPYQDVQTSATEQTSPPTIEPNLRVEPYQDVQTSATEQTTPPTIERNLGVERYETKKYFVDDKDPNLAILRSIKEQKNDNKIPLGKENNKMFDLLPAEKDDKINSCKCEDEKIEITNKQNKNAELLTLHGPIEPVTPTTIDPNSKVQPYPDVQIIGTEQSIPPTIKPNLGVEPYQDVQTTATEQTTPPSMEPNSEAQPYPDVQTIATEVTPPTLEPNFGVEPYLDVQTVAIKKIQQINLTKIVFDKASQTEWYNTLLEARCQQDGHYSLHFPPLALLKNPNQFK